MRTMTDWAPSTTVLGMKHPSYIVSARHRRSSTGEVSEGVPRVPVYRRGRGPVSSTSTVTVRSIVGNELRGTDQHPPITC